MAKIQRALQRTRGFTSLAAAGVTLLFSLPLGLFLGYQQYLQGDEALLRTRHHASRHLGMLDESLGQAREGVRLLAEALSSHNGPQLQPIAEAVLKMSRSASHVEVLHNGEVLFAADRDGPAARSPATRPALAGALPYLAGDPVVSIQGDVVVVSQPLATPASGGGQKFWGNSTATLPLAALASASRLTELAEEGYGVRLRHIYDGIAPASTIFEHAAGDPRTLSSQILSIPGSGTLQLEVQSRTAGFSPLHIIVTWLFFTVGTVLFYLLTLRLLRRPAELEKQVALRTQQLDQEKHALQREIANRIQAEGMLERSHRLLDTIFEHIPGMIILKRASDLRIARVNRSGEEVLGRTRDALIGRCNEEIYPPELADRLSQSDYQAMGDSQPVELPLEKIEMHGQPERWLRFRKIVLNDGNGRPEYILEFGEDITERERLDLRLREHLNFLEQLIDAIPGPLFFKDARGHYLGVNTAYEKFMGVKRAEIAGKTVFDVAPHKLAYIHNRADLELLTHGGTQIFESKASHVDGSERHVMFHKAVFHATSGETGGIVGIMLDITERKAAEERIRQLNRMLTVLSRTNQAIVRIQDRDRLLAVVTGLMQEEGNFPVAWAHLDGDEGPKITAGSEDSRELARRMTAAVTAQCRRCDPSGPLYCEPGQCFPEDLSSDLAQRGLGSFVHLPLTVQGRLVGGIGILDSNLEGFSAEERGMLADFAENVSFALEAFAIEESRNFFAHYDSLTRLPNRVLFHDRLGQALAKARSKGTSAAVMAMDIDRFKFVNDSIGHGAGDRLLREIAKRLTACVPAGDTVCRLGGDEFAVIATDLRSPGEAATRAEAIQHALRQPVLLEGHEIHVSVSIGISLFPDDADNLETLLGNADSAMYSAVDGGGNTFRFFQQEMNSRSAERMRIESKLHHALERGELAVYFQPLVSARTGQIIGAEALMRWFNQEADAFIPPSTFVPLLEETGLIVPIGEWVLRTACAEARRWREATGRDLLVAVNLSAHQLADDKLVDKVRAILEGTDFDPRHLEIELTESAVMRDADYGIRTMRRLKDLGVSLSIDDFGTGYSSLSYLKQLPLDTLKIDRSFVIDAPANPEAVSIIRAIVALGHSLHFDIIAEGVETPDQVDFLRQSTVDILQGFQFSKALPAEEFLELVARTPAYDLGRGDGEKAGAMPIPFRPRARG